MEGHCHIFIFGLLVVSSAAKTSSKVYLGMATRYDDVKGEGSEGGACGYTTDVHVAGYRTRETAVSDVLFMGGLGCGACYKVMCYNNSACNTKSITVVAMDQGPGGQDPRFDISGSAFVRLARDKDHLNELLNIGPIQVAWKPTPCKYGSKKIVLRVMDGSNLSWLSVEVEFVNGDGDIKSMQIQQVGTENWQEMGHVWGASWHAEANGEPLVGPFNIQIISSTKSLVLENVIPSGWKIGTKYTSHVNFNV